MAALDLSVPTLVGDILAAVRTVIDEDLPALRDFARHQAEAIAEQTALIAKGIERGWIETAEERRHWAATVRAMAVELAKTLRALVVITIEKAVNAILGVLEGALRRAVGVSLPF